MVTDFDNDGLLSVADLYRFIHDIIGGSANQETVVQYVS